MDVRQIEFLIESIDRYNAQKQQDVKDITEDKYQLNDNPMWLKSELYKTIGEAQGNMLFLRAQLEALVEENRPKKKFYQFWK